MRAELCTVVVVGHDKIKRLLFAKGQLLEHTIVWWQFGLGTTRSWGPAMIDGTGLRQEGCIQYCREKGCHCESGEAISNVKNRDRFPVGPGI